MLGNFVPDMGPGTPESGREALLLEDPAQFALDLFNRANAAYPGPARGAQAAAVIALEARELAADPLLLRDELRGRDDLVVDIMNRANEAHVHTPRAPWVGYDAVRETIFRFFSLAYEIEAQLEAHEIEAILTDEMSVSEVKAKLGLPFSVWLRRDIPT